MITTPVDVDGDGPDPGPNPVLISTLVVVNIIWWMVMIAGIGLGATHLQGCPVQPGIPVFLIGLGAATLLSLCLTYIRSGRREGTLALMSLIFMGFMYIFSFFWFIAGTSWVYSIYPPSYTPGEALYCHKTTFQYAFAVTTLTWVFLMLILVIGCCFAALTCCGTVRARHDWMPNRKTYGAITSSSWIIEKINSDGDLITTSSSRFSSV